jgi:HlyD family secretion protein
MDEVYVETLVDEVDIGKVREGLPANVVADAFPDDTFRGEVVRIAPLGTTAQNVTTFKVIVLVRNINGKLKAGMSASVDIEIFRRHDILLVANEALKDPRTPEGRAILEEAGMTYSPPKDTTPVAKNTKSATGKKAGTTPSGETDFQAMRERMRNASPEEREKLAAQFREQLQKRLQSMTPEERERFAQMRRERMAEGGGGGGMMGGGMIMFGGPGGEISLPAAERPVRRRSQVEPEKAVRDRVVMVREGETYVPRLIKIGVSNFDFAEVVEGLKEGDEIQMVTISQAKIEAEQRNERMRTTQGLGGMGGTTRGMGR